MYNPGERANLMGMSDGPLILDGSPFVEYQMQFDYERIVGYQLGIDAGTISDFEADRLGEAWVPQRTYWLAYDFGLDATNTPGKNGHELLVLRNAEGEVVAKVPAGLKPSVERLWLRTGLGLQDGAQEGIGDVAPELTERVDEEPASKAGLFRGIFSRLVGREQRDSMDVQEQATDVDKSQRKHHRIARVVAGVAALAMAGVGGMVASGGHSTETPKHAGSITAPQPGNTAPTKPVSHKHVEMAHERHIVNSTDEITIRGNHIQAVLKEGGNPWQAAKDVLQAEHLNSDNASVAHEVAMTGISNQKAHFLPVGAVMHFK